MTKVSIIVPIYNSENYLKDCLESLINQSFKYIEIICINDGSTDKSLNILNKYQLQDNRIKVFSQKNKGVSSARNLGLKKVCGDFFFFVDADDWIELDSCEKLYNTAIERNSDILLFPYYKTTKGDLEKDSRLLSFEKKYKNNNTNFTTAAKDIFDIPLQVAGKFYSSKLLKNGIEFPLNLQHGEDRVFFISACTKAKNISVLKDFLYYYKLDIPNSLTKSGLNTIPHLFESDKLIKKIIYSNIEPKCRDEVYYSFLEKTTNVLLHFWNNCYNLSHKPQNLKYLVKTQRDFNKLNKKLGKYSEEYQKLSSAIYSYKTLFIKKLFEPVIEIEFRRNRIVIYLFEHQILNFSIKDLNKNLYMLRYFKHLVKLFFVAKKRKIRVGFWVTETQKWSSLDSFYYTLKNSDHFEPFVLLSYFKKERTDISKFEFINNAKIFFEKNNIKYYQTFSPENNQYLSLKKFKPDIVFYQQPWQIHENQNLVNTSKFALTGYIPYCYYSLDSHVNYLHGFHGLLWKYFVESEKHKKEYENKYNAKNCIAVGSTKFDNYKNIKTSNNLWKTNKKRIIYAPHHSFNDNIHEVATFKENGKFILNLAKNFPETEWILRPHPSFLKNIIDNNIMSLKEIKDYFAEWEKIGSIYTENDYYKLFNDSDCLITDCISFLTEYLPTKKPIIHLRKDFQHENFNELLSILTEDYYKIFNNETLEKIFIDVIINENDYLKEKRCNNIQYLMIDNHKTTSVIIKEYLEKILRLKR